MKPRFNPQRAARRQTTIARAFDCRGRGVHGDAPARLRVSPAPAGAGIVFLREGRQIDAVWRNAEAAPLRTQLRCDGAAISTIEHLMAALHGLGVDNALIEIDAGELPALDGSAREFVSCIAEAGLLQLDAPARRARVVKPARVSVGAAWAELSPLEDGLRLDVEIAYAGAIGRQRIALDVTPENVARELAPARSFGFLADAERLWAQGLALGATLDNSVILDGDHVLNPAGLRFRDEFARHKALDALGDLALFGARLEGAFRSFRGGHALNLALVREAMATGAVEICEAEGEPRAALVAASP